LIQFIDTHSHLDGPEFADDLPDVIARAKEAGVSRIFIPGINLDSLSTVPAVCRQFPGYCYGMIGLQPEEVKADYKTVLDKMHAALLEGLRDAEATSPIAIGECGLDFYWSREFEQQQLDAFEIQVQWAADLQLPLMIHCRKAQNELLHILDKYKGQLCGGVFHCFTGNPKEAERYLQYPGFVLGVGGVSTFKSSHLRSDLPQSVPLTRLVLETDSPYMAPVPHRGQRNESAFVADVLRTLAEAYQITPDELAKQTNENVKQVFGIE